MSAARFTRPSTPPGQLAAWAVLLVLSAGFAACFSWLSVARHMAYQSHAFDLGNMQQAAWSTVQGDFLRFTDMQVGNVVLTNRLAIHVEPLLALISPLELLHPGPETLLVAQAVVVALGAVPAYLLGRAAVENPWLALVFPIAYLAHPSLQNLLLDDFHPVAFSACLLLWALWFGFTGRIGWFAAVSLLAMASKENIGLLVATLALWMAWRQRDARILVLGVFGALWFLCCIAVIIPHFNPTGQSPYLERYAYLGHGLKSVLLGIVRHPNRVAQTLTSPSRVTYFDVMLHPMGYVPLLAPWVLLLSLPSLLINLLSADPTMYSGSYQYSAEVLPFVIGAAAFGVGWVYQRVPGAGAVLCALLLLASLVDTWRFGFSPLANGYVVPSAGTHQALENRALRLIPRHAVVAAADEIEPHLADRRWVYMLPTVHPSNGPAAQYIVLDASIPSLPITPRTLHASALRAMNHGYGVVFAQDGVLVLHRGHPARRPGPRFFNFMFHVTTHMTPSGAIWGPMVLRGYVVHPRSGFLSRSRPSIGLETVWRTSRHLSTQMRIDFYLSPVYQGRRPCFSSAWQRESDSPTWDWLPLTRWPLHRSITAASLPLTPDVYQRGKVDVAVGVRGVPISTSHGIVCSSAGLLRLGTIQVGY